MSSNKPHYEAELDAIEKRGSQSWTFRPRGFNIIWGHDERYWNLPKKGTDDPAELVQVCWLELTGTTKDSLPEGKYEIKFKLEVKPGAFGLSNSPIFMMAKVGKRGRYKWNKIKLQEKNSDNRTAIVEPTFQIDVKGTADDNKLYFGLYEVWTGKWKGGLLIHGATVDPVTS